MSIARLFSLVSLLVVSSSIGNAAESSDVDDLKTMLHEFLAGADVAEAHEKFWADDLVYTSSRGTRTTKAEIMKGFAAADSEENETVGPVYSAEDIQIKIYGSTAVVAFRLVATPPDDSAVLNYFNTCTFLKRDGVWQGVAWQATFIPATDTASD